MQAAWRGDEQRSRAGGRNYYCRAVGQWRGIGAVSLASAAIDGRRVNKRSIWYNST